MMKPTTNHRLQIETRLRPMGFALRVVSNSPAVIEAANASFGRFGSFSQTTPPDFTFRFFEHALDDGQSSSPFFRREGHLLHQSTGRASTLVADLARGIAVGYFSASTLANPVFFRWHFLELALFQMLEWRGLMGVHASALVKNDRAVLLRAPSGSGKSTLAYAGARTRFQTLAEDVVWTDCDRKLWWGLPWSFHLLPDAKALFPELRSIQPTLQTNGEMKLEVNPEKVRPGSTVCAAQPGAVVLVQRTPGGRSRLEPIDLETARTDWSRALTGLEMTLPHHHPCLQQLLQRPTYRFYYGDDIEASLDLLDTLFE